MPSRYIDLHCDTLLEAYLTNNHDLRTISAMVNLDKLLAGGAAIQAFACFFPPQNDSCYAEHGLPVPSDETYFHDVHEILDQNFNFNRIFVQAVLTKQDLDPEDGKIGALFTMEDGRAVQGSFDQLEYFFLQGVRLISLTWNGANCFGFPNSRDYEAMQRGLTAFGKEAVQKMQEDGVIVDCSHLSDGGFWDLIDIMDRPFLASHSNCRELSPHPRNLTDAMIRALANKGGISGLNFCPVFTAQKAGKQPSRLEDIAAHLHHMIQVGGEDFPALGTDFDGIGGELEVPDAAAMPKLFDYLKSVGFTERQIEKIASENARRVLSELLPD